jgi:hypothetical protein
MKLSGLPSTDIEQALKNAVAVLKSKKPRITDEEAVSIAHDMLVASVPSICAGAIQRVAESEKDYIRRSQLWNKATVSRTDIANNEDK